MTRLKPKFLDRVRGAISQVDKKLGTGQDVNDSKIKELEEQMDTDALDGARNLGVNNQKGFSRPTRKSHKGLR